MSVVKRFIAMCKRSFGIGFLSLSFISSVFCIQTQTPEIQADSYLYNHLAQVAEYEAVRDLLVEQPRLHDAFTEVTGWMFDRTRPTVAERKKAQELLKRIDTSPRVCPHS